MSQKYAIIDIETTGMGQQGDRITEIAIILHDGTNIIDEFSSLINPERAIPFQISHLTGITDDMVEDAPKFYEIAKKVVEMTKDTIFVAHNASFDYNFICREFKMLEYNFKRKTLCTVKLSRKLLPGFRSYSLGKLCADLNIEINGRHRAYGDALATAKLFEILNKKSDELEQILLKTVNTNLKHSTIKNLPKATGVYYFYDENNELIYVGKSNNIYDRILSHLNNQTTKRAIEMKSRIADIHYTITGSELVALLLESHEIKTQKPVYNRAQRRTGFPYGIFSFVDKGGYICFAIKRSSSKGNLLNTCTSKREATEVLTKYTNDLELCHKLTGLYPSTGACFHYTIKQCKGACTGEEHPITYNQRAQQLIDVLTYDTTNSIIIDIGRDDEERAVVCIEKGKYLGYGYISVQEQYPDIESIKRCITNYQDNRDIKQIIKSYLKKNTVEKVINY